MTQRELKQKLYELVRVYFKDAAVVWGKTKAVSPQEPLITLTMGSVSRPYQPITKWVRGVPIDCWPSKTALQIDLYTKGENLTDSACGITAARENTAVNDLSDFVNFINSAYADNWSLANDVSLLARQVHDLTELINDTAWDYRAMAELEIGYTQNAAGYAGMNYEGGNPLHDNGHPKYDADGNALDKDGNILPEEPAGPPPFRPNPSGGGTQELAESFTGWFERVEEPENVKELKQQ
jgi:hypothetical protein